MGVEYTFCLLLFVIGTKQNVDCRSGLKSHNTAINLSDDTFTFIKYTFLEKIDKKRYIAIQAMTRLKSFLFLNLHITALISEQLFKWI